MSDQNEIRQIQFFVSSECETCEQVETFLQGWTNDHPPTTLAIMPVLEYPEEVVRLQIFYTPAVVVNGKVLSEPNLSIEKVAQFLDNPIPQTKSVTDPDVEN